MKAQLAAIRATATELAYRRGFRAAIDAAGSALAPEDVDGAARHAWMRDRESVEVGMTSTVAYLIGGPTTLEYYRMTQIWGDRWTRLRRWAEGAEEGREVLALMTILEDESSMAAARPGMGNRS